MDCLHRVRWVWLGATVKEHCLVQPLIIIDTHPRHSSLNLRRYRGWTRQLALCGFFSSLCIRQLEAGPKLIILVSAFPSSLPPSLRRIGFYSHVPKVTAE
jgi:hypothetical protein